MQSSLSGLSSRTPGYSDLTQDTHSLALTISQLEAAVKTGIVTRQPLEYIITSLIQAGGFKPDSDETGLIDAFYCRIYGEHLPTYVTYVGQPKRSKMKTDIH